LKLNLEISESDGVTLVHCKGRITYRNEAAELSATVGALLSRTRYLVLDLSGVERSTAPDWANSWFCTCRPRLPLRFQAGRSASEIWELLQLTNLTSSLKLARQWRRQSSPSATASRSFPLGS